MVDERVIFRFSKADSMIPAVEDGIWDDITMKFRYERTTFGLG